MKQHYNDENDIQNISKSTQKNLKEHDAEIDTHYGLTYKKAGTFPN